MVYISRFHGFLETISNLDSNLKMSIVFIHKRWNILLFITEVTILMCKSSLLECSNNLAINNLNNNSNKALLQ